MWGRIAVRSPKRAHAPCHRPRALVIIAHLGLSQLLRPPPKGVTVHFKQATSSPRLEMHSHSCPRATPRACPAPSAITASGGEPGVAWIDAGKQSRECEFTGESHSGIDAASSSCRVTQYSVSLPLSPSLPLSLYLIITILPTPLPSTSSCPSICMSRCVCTQTGSGSRVWGLGTRILTHRHRRLEVFLGYKRAG